MNDEFSFLNILNSGQREVCNDLRNYLITACPGSGKTRTLTYRLAFFQKKYPDSQKYNVAITYTNRAAIEIDVRLNEMGIDLSSIWTGTIHQFCMNFIIRPYAMYSNDLKKGYHVIDEYVQRQYCLEIAKKLGIDVGFKNPLEFDSINKLYHQRLKDNKEIDFDMILEISKYLVTNYQFISENISCLFRSIHVDEYQDTNQFQYEILAAIFKSNKKINLFFVGDPNQAIYSNLGGIPKKCNELEELFGVKFCEKELNGCYRSTQRMIDYYSNFENIKSNVYSKSSNRYDKGNISYNYKIDVSRLPEEFANIILEKIGEGVAEKDICIVAPQWYQIYPLANKLRKYLPNIKFDAPDISPFKFDPINPFYISYLIQNEDLAL
ncbi:UvrD-helicase domain-containing protein [[Clostridium] innocuum]|uniref:UvrD-helicase domain-containing protein n=1 Tax=Clostridium innocuum TaxID=1522 RepID=UPI003A4E31E4